MNLTFSPLHRRQLYSSPVNNQPYLSSASSSTTPSKIQSRTYSNQLLPLTSDLENRHALPHQLTTISASFSPQPMSTTPILSRLKKEYIGPNLNSTPIIERRRLMREEMERNRLQTPGGAAAVAVSYSSPVQMLISP